MDSTPSVPPWKEVHWTQGANYDIGGSAFPNTMLPDVASSSNGETLVVVKSGTSQGNVYLSDDRGVTWKEIYDPGVILTDPPSWTHVTSNSDGITIAVM